MPTQQSTDDRVLDVVRFLGCTLEDIMLECPDLTWNQVFIAIDRFTREGVLTLTPKGRGVYTVHLSSVEVHAAPDQAPV